MNSNIINLKKTEEYQYVNLIISDKGLVDYEIVNKWNKGADIIKHGANIEIKLRKSI